MIKNIIFDLGNVLLSYKPLEYLRTKVSDENLIQQLHSAIFLSEEWPMLDRGIITEAEAIARMMAKNSSNRELIRLCMQNWYELLTPIPETVDVLKKVKQAGVKTYILSNFHLLAYENVVNRFEFFQLFDGGIISCREQLLKPEPEIYNKLIKSYNLIPSQSIFIDDCRDNTESAEKLGFQTITFDNSTNLRSKLLDLNILNENDIG